MSSFQDRLLNSIPGGAHTYSKGYDQFSSNTPEILERGKGAYVFAPDNKCYLDYGMGLRAITLGYADEDVNRAAIKQIYNGNNLTRPSTIELEAAELITNLIPSADMVKFAKNGSNVTTAAVKLARAYTNKRYICIPRQQPFFSFDDWFIGTTPVKNGIPSEHYQWTLTFDYGDISSLSRLFEKYENEIAAVMLEPATSEIPCPTNCNAVLSYDSPCNFCENKEQNFLFKVQELCKKNQSLFILDEMISGFRWDLRGAQNYFGVVPDMSTFGKAMANGFSVSALTGRRDIMEHGSISQIGVERTFLLSSTHGAEMCSLGAFVETVSKYKELDVCKHLWNYGSELKNMFIEVSREIGIEEYFNIYGPFISLSYNILDRNRNPCPELKTLFQQEMVKSGVIMPWISVSYSHGKKELEMTQEAARKALRVVKCAIDSNVNRFLEGEAIKPVFRQYN